MHHAGVYNEISERGEGEVSFSRSVNDNQLWDFNSTVISFENF